MQLDEEGVWLPFIFSLRIPHAAFRMTVPKVPATAIREAWGFGNAIIYGNAVSHIQGPRTKKHLFGLAPAGLTAEGV